MAWSDCTVFLNSTTADIFYSGELVTGSISLSFKRKQQIDFIKCTILGVSKASWSRPSPTIPYIRIYSANYKILDIELDIFDDYSGKSINPGIETRNFYFSLPADLPSSFKSSIATVKYFVQIESKSGFRCRKKKIFPFSIYGKVNLSHLEKFVTPTFYEFHKTLCLSRKMLVNLKTFTGFAPKQHLPFEVLITNENKVKIIKLKVNLIQKVKYSITAGHAEEEIKICKVENKLSSKNQKEVCLLNMEIPEIPPSSIYLDDPLVGISYILRVEISCQFCRFIQEDVNVTVSTVPVIHFDNEAMLCAS